MKPLSHFLVLVFTVTLASPAYAADSSNTQIADSVDSNEVENESVDRVVRERFPEGFSGGVAVYVRRDGELVHRKGYGSVGGQPLTSASPLKLASISKQFAAMCVMMLIDEGNLSPKDKVIDLVPEWKTDPAYRPLLVQDLLWHTNGLANFINQDEKKSINDFKAEHELSFLNNRTHAKWLAQTARKGAPGVEHSYTNSGYVLLARIVELIAEEPFHQFQQRRIFDALGMASTTNSSRFNGSGSMSTTLLDYGKWNRTLWGHDSRLLTAGSHRRLFVRGQLDDGQLVEYGYGWRLKYSGDDLVYAEHGGAGSAPTAARNWVRRYTDRQTTIAVFSQEHPSFVRSERESFVDKLYASLDE